MKKLASTETRLISRCTAIGSLTTSRPKTVICPPSGMSRVAISRMSVDLPLPLGPSTPKISPRRTLNETLFTATVVGGVPSPFARFQKR